MSVKSIASTRHEHRILVNINIHGLTVQMQYDTGSDITIIGQNVWHRLGKPTLASSIKISHTDGNDFITRGYFSSVATIQEHSKEIHFHVSIRNNLNLLGLDAIKAFNLWNIPKNKRQETNQVAIIQTQLEENIKLTIDREIHKHIS